MSLFEPPIVEQARTQDIERDRSRRAAATSRAYGTGFHQAFSA
jgi:hypothetical protein